MTYQDEGWYKVLGILAIATALLCLTHGSSRLEELLVFSGLGYTLFFLGAFILGWSIPSKQMARLVLLTGSCLLFTSMGVVYFGGVQSPEEVLWFGWIISLALMSAWLGYQYHEAELMAQTRQFLLELNQLPIPTRRRHAFSSD